MADKSPEIQLVANFEKVFKDLQGLVSLIGENKKQIKELQAALTLLGNDHTINGKKLDKLLPKLDKTAAKQFKAELQQLVQFGSGDLSAQVNTAVTNALISGLKNQMKATVDAVKVEVDKLTREFSPQALAAKGILNNARIDKNILSADREREVQAYMRSQRGWNVTKDVDQLKLREEAAARNAAAYRLSGNEAAAKKELDLHEKILARRREIEESAKRAADLAKKAMADREAQARVEARIADSIARLQVKGNATTNPVAKAKVEVSAAEQALNLGRVKNLGKEEMDALVASYEKAQARLELLTRAQKEYDATVRDGANKARHHRESQEREVARLQKQIEQLNLKANATLDPVERAKVQLSAAGTALNLGKAQGVGATEMDALIASYRKAQHEVKLLSKARKENEQDLAKGISLFEKERQINALIAATTNEVKKAKEGLRLAELQLQAAVASGSNGAVRAAIDRYRQMERTLNDTIVAQKKLADATKTTGHAQRSPQEIAARTFEIQNARMDLNGGANQFAAQGRVLSNYAIMGGMIASFAGSINQVRELEQGLSQLQAISGATSGELAKVRDVIMSVAQNSRFSAAELAEGATVMAQAGFSAAEVSQSLKPIADFATATGTSMKEAMDTATSAMSVFKLRTEETRNVTDMFTAALNDTKLDPQKLALGLQYVSNVAAESNVTLTELTAVMGALSNAGIRSGSTIATGLRQLIIDLSAPSKKLIEELEKVGLTVDAVDIRTQGLVGVLRNMREAGFSTANAMNALEVRAANAYSALGLQLSTLPGLIEGLDKVGKSSEANAIQMDTLNSAVIRAQNTWGAMMTRFFGPSMVVLKNLLNAFSDLANGINEVPYALEIAGTAFSTFVGVKSVQMVASLTAGLVKLALGIAAVGTTSTAAAVGVNTLNTAVSGIGKGNLIIAALSVAVAAATVVWQKLEQQVETTDSRLEKINSTLEEVKGRLANSQSSLAAVNDEMQRLSERSASFTDQDFPSVIANLRSRFSDLGIQIDSSTNSVGQLLNSLDELKRTLANRLTLDLQINDTMLQVKIAELNNKRNEMGQADAIQKGTALSDQFIYSRGLFGRSTGRLLPGVSETNDPRSAIKAPDAPNQPLEQRIGNLTLAIREFFGRAGTHSGDYDNVVARAMLKIGEYQQEVNRKSVDKDDPRRAALDQLSTYLLEQTKVRREADATEKAQRENSRAADQNQFNATTLAPLERSLRDITMVVEQGRRNLTVPNLNIDQKLAVNRGILNGGTVNLPNGQTAVMPGVKKDLEALLGQLDSLPADQRENNPAVKKLRDDVKSLMTEIGGKITEATKVQGEETKKALDYELRANAEQQKAIRAKLGSRTLKADDKTVSALQNELEAAVREEYNLKRQQLDIEFKEHTKNGNKPATKAYEASKRALDAAMDAELEKVRTNTDSLRDGLSRVGEEYDDFIDRMKDSFKNIANALKVGLRRNAEPVRELDMVIASAEAPQNRNRVSSVEMEFLKRRRYELQTEQAGQNVKLYDQQILQVETSKEEIDRKLAMERSELASLQQKQRTKGNIAQIDGQIRRTQEQISKLTSEQQEAERKLEEYSQKRAENAERYEIGTREHQPGSFGQTFNNSVTLWQEANGFNKDMVTQFGDELPSAFQAAQDGFSNMVASFAAGSMKAGQAVRSMALSILESMLKIATNKLAGQLLGLAFNALGGLWGGSADTTAATDFSTVPVGDGGTATAQKGGLINPSQVRHLTVGGPVVGGVPGRDSVPALLDPGEFVLRRSAVNLVGRDYLEQLNANGNRIVDATAPAPINDGGNGGGGLVNVWVVSKDNVPPPSKNDIIAYVSEDMARGGTTKKLVKSIAMGTL